MDTAPPQAPPALMLSTQQEGIDAVARMASRQRWIATQQALMPSVDDIASQRDVDAFLTALDAYWIDSVRLEADRDSMPRQQALAWQLAGLARDIAALMARDGSLDDTAATAAQALAANLEQIPAGLHASELLVNGVPLAGTLVLQNDNQPGQAIVLTLDGGWKVIGNLDAYYRELEHRMRHALTRRSDLPAMDRMQSALAMQRFSAGLRTVEGSPWQAMAKRIVDLQKEKFRQAWFQSQVMSPDASPGFAIIDQMRDTLELDAVIDIDAMLATRDERLYLAHQEDRLAAVPAPMRQDWIAAALAYRSAHRAAAGILADHGIAPPVDALAFALQRNEQQPAIALYDAYLESLRSGRAGELRKQLTTGLSHALMRIRAEDARLGYVLSHEPATFRDDHSQRGYQWVKAVLDSPAPAGRAKVEGHEIVASQVLLAGIPVEGLIAIGVRQPQSVPTVVLYTPDAPDGKHFREFDDWQDATNRFLHHPMFHDYLAARVPQLPGDFGQQASLQREIKGDVLDAHFDDALAALSQSALIGDSAMPSMLTAPFRHVTPPWYATGSGEPASRGKRDLFTWLLRPFRRKPRWPKVIGGSMPDEAWGIVHLRTQDLTPEPFEPRFLATRVRKQGEPDSHGLYRIGGQTYIDHDGLMYGARYDEQMSTVRLRRPDAAPTAYGPPIQRIGTNRWTHHRTGLLGGGDRPRPASLPPARNPAPPQRGIRYFQRLIGELEDAFPNPVQREAALVDLRHRIGNPGYVRTLSMEHQHRLDFAVNHAADVHPPRLPSTPAPAPPGYRVLTDTEIPELAYTPWRSEGHLVQIRTFGGRPSTYLRMESDMVSVTHQGITMRSTTTHPVSLDVPSYSLRIRLREAYDESIQAGQARFDVYRHLQNPDDLIVRPRSDLPLLLHNTEYAVALSPMNDLPSLHELLE
ncbi:hypothetical protein KR767_08505 [Luteibacter anthropi]|uniref:DUF6543 domain-containing protein n=1 Tax=Luteibacter anthropi TaxID=564369 RepID=UPI002032E5FF|nr:DUF6543 domain-containing protein [Luteibacter anthropi]URX64070.1 hypothetical protein KR767_08505 [Luteibacter anthropi]